MTKTLKHNLFITTIAAFMIVIYLDQNGIGITLTHIQSSFGINNTMLQWIMNSMLIATAVSVLIAGKLGDMFGTRRLFCIGLIGFIIASVLCGVAPNYIWMIAGRALQGITASFMLTNYMVLIHHQYTKKESPKVIGLCVSISAIFGAAAPAVAGILTEWLSWRGFFLINIPICLTALILTFFCIDKTPGHASKENIDYAGMGLLIVAIGACVSAITESSQFGWSNDGVLFSLLASICLFIAFFFCEVRHKNPVLHFEVLKNSQVLAGCIITSCLQVSLISTVYYALWMQHVLGFSAFITGLAYLPQSIPVIVMATYAGNWASHKGFRGPIVFGTTLASFSIIGLTLAFLTQNYWCIVPFLFLWAIGGSCAFPTSVSATLSSVDARHKGMAIGINQTFRYLANAIGLALFSTILVGIFGNHKLIITAASKTAYTHAFVYAMLLPTSTTLIAMLVAWRYIHNKSIQE